MASLIKKTKDTHGLAEFTSTNIGSTGETELLQVDVSTLGGVELTFTFTTMAADFTVGEKVTQTTSGATGQVISTNFGSDTAVIRLDFNSPAFDLSNTVTGDDSGSTGVDPITITDSGRISIIGLKWIIDGDGLTLEWDGSTNEEFLHLSGNGELSNKGYKYSLPSTVAAPTGDIDLTTTGTWTAAMTYTIYYKVRKESGFSYDPATY